MNKKRISKFVLGVGSVLPLVSFAASCSTTIDNNQQIVTPKDETKIDKRLIFDYKNKSDVLAPLATLDNVIIPQLDDSDDKVVLKNIEWDPADKSSVIVHYVIEDKNSNIKVLETTSKISGFKTEEISEGFPNVTITYKDKSKTVSADAKDQNIIVNNLDESKYDFIVKNKKADGNSLTIQYILKDKKSQTESDLRSVTLTGFQNPPEKSESLKNVLSKISVSYGNPEGTPINKVSWEKVTFSGIDLSKYSIDILENSIDENKLSITIVFRIFENGFESIKSDIKKVVISGFKPKSLTKLQLQEELGKITVEYPNKENVTLSEVTINNVAFKGVDNTKVKLNSIEFVPNNKTHSALVRFKVQDINYPDNLSDSREFVINGFAKNIISKEKIEDELKKVVISYPNMENIAVGKADKTNLKVSGFDNTLYTFKIDSFNIDDKLKLVVNLHIESLENPGIKSSEKTTVLEGFKRSELTNLIFGDSKGLLKLDTKQMPAIIKNLSEPKSEFVFDIVNKKVFIPSGSESLRLSDSATYKEVGVLTDLFKQDNTGWVKQTENILDSNLTVLKTKIFEEVKKFLTSSKEEAKKILDKISIFQSLASFVLGSKVKLDSKWFKSLNYLHNNDKYSIVYNPKTGKLVIGKGESGVDLSKSSTYTPFLTFNKQIKDNINAKIRELLKATGINESVVDVMLSDKITTLYTFEKSGSRVFSEIKLIQN